LVRQLKGDLQGQGLRIAVAVARFNEFVTGKLLEGALDALSRHGVRDDDTLVVWVPGAFELPSCAKILAQTQRYDAVICLGAVIRGETAHFDLVANQAAAGISRASMDTGVPVIFGVLSADDMDQAINRAGGKQGNVGYSSGVAAIEMGRLNHIIKGLEGS
jgi:6,7-dimethyl-8-ribityllumazine synthase